MFTNTLNPIFFTIGPLTIRWYGLFLTLGVISSVCFIYKLFKQKKYPTNLALDLCVWLIVGGLIGARLGEILFYEPSYYFSHPLEMIMINHGGLSSHGMTLGLIITFFLFIKLKTNNPLNPPFLRGKPNNPPFDKGGLGGLLDWKQILDILVIPIPLLATFIRIGNFFNSEIVGRTTNLPWAVKFPLYELNPLLRHPTQLYEAIFTLALFFILYSLFKKNSQKLPQLFIFHLFLLTYFGGRFLLEFTKEYQTSWEGILTAGQWLSIPFIIWGIAYLINNKKTPPK